MALKYSELIIQWREKCSILQKMCLTLPLYSHVILKLVVRHQKQMFYVIFGRFVTWAFSGAILGLFTGVDRLFLMLKLLK